METNLKMGLFKHTVLMCSSNCLFLFICLLIFGDLSKLILPLSFCVAIWDFYYIHLFFEHMKDDLNRIADFLEDYFNRLVDVNRIINFLIHFWFSFQNFINVLRILLDNFPWRQLIRFNGIIIWN